MSHRFKAIPVAACLSLGVACAVVVACSGHAPGSAFIPPENKAGAPTGGDQGNGSLTGGNGSGGLGSSGGGDPGDAACAAQTTKADQLPLDIYIMLDQSLSMLDTGGGTQAKWDAVASALKTFVQQPSLGGVSVGIQYFGIPDSTGYGGDSCNAPDYAKPEVEIAPLPGAASAITQSIDAHSPSSSTPTSAALQGAVQHATAWAQAHAGHVAIVVLATDGEPSECDTSLASIDAIAAAGANGTPKILTFVVGVGSSLAALNGIAQAGGSGSAFLVDTTGNVNQQFLDAMNKVRGAALGCQFQIPLPASGTPNYDQVNVEYAPDPGSPPVVIPKVMDKAHCPANGDAWYYDDNASPKQILLCDTSCSKATASATAVVNVLTGCQTIVK